MVSRRRFLSAASGASLSYAVRDAFGLSSRVNPFLPEFGEGIDALDNTKLVKIVIGTGGHGHCFPGATMPFGAVQLSPDTGAKIGIIARGTTTATAAFLVSATLI
jgi:putative alpha-1,2-mannosidase